jgi:nicotinate-nucleotide adenylyltransferase
MSRTAAARIGVYGGTFNPIHLGHLRAAEEVAEALQLERVLFVPSHTPPHKAAASEGGIASGSDRLSWVAASVADHDRFEACSLEVDRAGPSYLVDTLEILGREGNELPVFILGSDAFADMGNWREPLRLFRLAHYAVMNRPPEPIGTLADWIPELARGRVELSRDGAFARHREAPTTIRRVGIQGLPISASDIRDALRAGRSIRYLVPEVVRPAIEKCAAYRDAGAHPAGAGGNSAPSPRATPVSTR